MDPNGESLNTVLDTLQQWNEYLQRVSAARSQVPKPNRRATAELLERILTLSTSGESHSEIARQLKLEKQYVGSLAQRAKRRANL